MKMNKICLLAGLSLGLLLTGCGGAAPPAVKSQGRSATKGPDVPRSREADDVARFLAGLPGTPGSPFAAQETSEVWQTHRNVLDTAWGRAKTALVDKLSAFSQQELSDSAWASPVFYPFSGPDALTVTQFFPRSPVFTFVALEPAGTLPDIAQLNKLDSLKYLAETRETMSSVLGKSFFITRDMDKQFRGQITDGLLLPILQLLVRTQHQILGFRYVRLDENGEIIERAVNYEAPTRYGNKGVEVEFKTEADASIHTLYYFSVNLANDRLAENKPFLTHLSRLKGMTTLLKATSYMPHHKEFSTIRDGILAASANILQDDSGLPYASFRPEDWNVQLYGEYTKPYGSFAWLEQPALRTAYSAPGVKPLPLRLGYGYGKVGSNLLMARRRK